MIAGEAHILAAVNVGIADISTRSDRHIVATATT
jgi:hypothetical protein